MTTENNQDEFASVDELAAQQGQQTQNQPENKPDPMAGVPDKYRGKTPEELLAIAMEQDRFIGKQAEEVGFARTMVKQALERAPQNVKPPVDDGKNELDDIDFLADPKTAVRKAIESHPEVKAAKEMALQVRRQQMQQQVRATHSDIDQVVADPEFAQWVQASPARMMLLQHAENNFDAAAADEILSNFKMHRQVKSAQQQQEQTTLRQTQQENLKAAQVDGGTRSQSGGKVYRRADVREIMKDPARYAALGEEILRLYAEGRIRD